MDAEDIGIFAGADFGWDLDLVGFLLGIFGGGRFFRHNLMIIGLKMCVRQVYRKEGEL